MLRRPLLKLLLPLAFGLLSACGGTPYTPAPSQTEPLDLAAYAPKVDTFVVLLDTSGSMKKEDDKGKKIHSAQDLAASFNGAVPAYDFNAGMVIFGKGAGSCWGEGVARNIYGMTTYNSDQFLQAISSIECAASTTPIVDALDMTEKMLVDNTGHIAVVIFSDFKWSEPGAVSAAIERLKNRDEGSLCLHAVKIGDNASGDGLVADIIDGAGCDSNVRADDIAPADAMANYVADVLMAPIQYDKFNFLAMTLFDFNKADLKPQGKAELQRLGEHIKSQGLSVADIDIVGHTCSIGSEEYNQGLSERRAQAVKDYLVSRGIKSDMIRASGMGELDALYSNDTEKGRIQNRRVEVNVGTSRPAQ